MEAKDGYNIEVQASNKENGEVGDVKVDEDFVDEDYRVRDDDDFFDNFVDKVDEINSGEPSDASTNWERISCG